MANPPTVDPPEWATGVGAEITEPPSQRKSDGWIDEIIPPHQYVNWFWNRVYQWVLHLSGASSKFETLDALVDGLAEDETAILDENDTDDYPGTPKTLKQLGAADSIAAFAVTGKYVIVAIDDASEDLYLFTRDLQTEVRSFTRTYLAVASPKAVCSDGRYVIAVYGRYVECWDIETGTSEWDYNHGADLFDVCTDGYRVYIVGSSANGGGGGPSDSKNARAIRLSTGAVDWSYNHSSTVGHDLFSCCTTGHQLFIAGEASAYGSGANLRAILCDNGKDAAGEGGNGQDYTSFVWDVTTPTDVNWYRCLATDGKRLFVGFPSTATYELGVYSCGLGKLVAQMALDSDDVKEVTVDHQYVYVLRDAGTDGDVLCLTKSDLSVVWASRFRYGSTDYELTAVVSDGAAVYEGITYGVGGSTNNARKIIRGNTPKLWRRVDPDDRYLKYRQLAIPEED